MIPMTCGGFLFYPTLLADDLPSIPPMISWTPPQVIESYCFAENIE